MITQADLFRPMCAKEFFTQADLFPDHTDPDSDIRCEECGEFLVETPHGYLCCPKGHGKLLQEAVEQEVASWEDE